jgi:hypothetical protein
LCALVDRFGVAHVGVKCGWDYIVCSEQGRIYAGIASKRIKIGPTEDISTQIVNPLKDVDILASLWLSRHNFGRRDVVTINELGL